jgi:tRNA threonylcarbamoyladenosine modification (KEOPS) complex  Pcc1 subunit
MLIESRLNGMDMALEKSEQSAIKRIDQIDTLLQRMTGSETRVESFVEYVRDRMLSQREAVAVSLNALESGIVGAQNAAERAAAKADLAADKIYLEAQIYSVKDLANQQVSTLKETIGAALASADRAVSKAEIAAEKRFEDTARAIGNLSEQQRQSASKSEMDFRFAALDEKVNIAVSTLDINKGKGDGASSLWGIMVTAIGVIISITGVVLVLTLKN